MRGRIVRTVFLAALCLASAAAANANCLTWDPSAPGGWRDAGNGWRSIPVAAEFDRAFAVVTAKVRSIRHIPDDDNFVFMKYEVLPFETFKGPQLGSFTIFDENDSGRFFFEAGKSYLLFVTAEGKHSVVDSCGWSDRLSAAGETLRRVRALADTQ
jgi:hypothetical protein